jgi:hypothetical protein
MKSRERWIYYYTLTTSLVLLIGAWADPPQSAWRIVLNVGIPITLILGSVWGLISSRRS